jgi:UMF1 family MFS transporter
MTDGEAGAYAPPPLASFRERLSWSLYGFANTSFSMNILTLFFAAWVVSDLRQTNFSVAVAGAIASVMVLVSIPIFGALSDVTQRRKPWIIGFTLLASAATVVIAIIGETRLPVVGEGTANPSAIANIPFWPLFAVLAAFTIANYAHQASQPFYNAMMGELAPPERRGRLSGMGEAFAYSGAIIGVLLCVPFFTGTFPGLGPLPPHLLATLKSILPLTSPGGRVSTFFPTVVIFLLFSLPLFLFCRDHNATRVRKSIPWKDSFREVATTFAEARKYPGVARFVLTSFLYQDAMGTILGNMALYAIMAMGFKKGSEATLLIVLTMPAVLGSYLIGKVVDWIGPKRTLRLVLLSWVVLLTALILTPSVTAFWIIGAMIGFIYGGVWTAERPMLLSLVPDREAGRFFSLMVLSGRAAALVGPVIFSVTVDNLRIPIGTNLAYRAGVFTVMLGMLGALLLLRGVPDNSARATTS